MNTGLNSGDAVSVAILPTIARFNLRIAMADLAIASKAFGLNLPRKVGQGERDEFRAAYCIGPDEWLLHAKENDQQAIIAAFENIRINTAHSLTVISDRECTIGVCGHLVFDLLATGCPLDVSKMEIGCAKRTVFDYAQVVLIRDAEDAFRLEVWRSYLPHVHGLLEIAANELATGL